MLKSICVYCGASDGNSIDYQQTAIALGKTIAQQQRRLIYGGGAKGLMGVVADAVLSNGGEVIGVIPERLVAAETAHKNLSELIVVKDMHQRKAKMIELADGFMALPGGIGTLEELYEVWTWSQIGYHQKPVGVVNVNNFYTPMVEFLEHMANEGFVRSVYLDTLLTDSDPVKLLNKFDQYTAHNLERWVKS